LHFAEAKYPRRSQRYYLFAKRKTGPVDFSGPVG
jgi:hypothetical protein